MTIMTPDERELAELIIQSLNLEDVRPEDIKPDDALFHNGLGLDSIDALELALAIGQRYGIQLRSENTENQHIFASLRALNAYIQTHKQP